MGFFSDVDMNDIEKGIEISSDETVQSETANSPSCKLNFNDLLETPAEAEPIKKENPPQKDNSECGIHNAELKEIIRDSGQKKSEPVRSFSQKMNESNSSTVIAIGTIVEGNVRANGVLSVAGTVNGDVSADAGVTVFRKGTINGNISAKGRVIVNGTVSGDISGDEITLEKTNIRGSVSAAGIVAIGNGAIVIGNITAENANIIGAVNGDIDVKGHVFIESSAIVKGNIRSKTVQIANGAAVDGTCSQCYADINPSAFFENLEKKK